MKNRLYYLYLLTGICIFYLNSYGQTSPSLDNKYRDYIVHYNPTNEPNILALLSSYFNEDEKDINKRSIALIAGVSNYKSSQINNLPPAENDINNLISYLKDTQKFDEIIVLKNKNVNQTNLTYFLTDYLPKRFSKYKKTKFLFAYSGHGSQNIKSTRGYLVKHDANNLSDRANSIPLTILSALLDESISNCFQSLVLINSCYGGHFVNIPVSFGSEDNFTKRSGHHVITAGSANQQVFAESNKSGSYFFDIILKGLKTGHADSGPNGNDGIITTREIMNYLESQTPDDYQIPKLGGLVPNNENNGYFYFYNNSKIESKNTTEKSNLSLNHFISFGKNHDKFDFTNNKKAESSNRSAQILLMGEILKEVNNELTNLKNTLSSTLVGSIISLTKAMKPYRYLKNEKLIEKPRSPERGQLLISLVESKIDSSFFENRILKDSYFMGAELTHASFNDANLGGIKLSNSDLFSINLKRVNLKNAFLNDSDLRIADLSKADISKANFGRTDMEFSILDGAVMKQTYFGNANLKRASLKSTNIWGAKFNDAILVGTVFTDSSLKFVDFSNLDLYGAKFDNTEIDICSFENSRLKYASFEKSFLKDVSFESSDLSYVDFRGTHFNSCDFQSIKSLKGVKVDRSDWFTYLKKMGVLGTNKIANQYTITPFKEYDFNKKQKIILYYELKKK